MKIHPRLALGLAAASLPLLLALRFRGDEVAFEPKEGTRLAKELALDMTFHMEDISVTINGQEMPAEQMGGAMDEALLLKAVIGVTEEYVKSQRGRHEELLRTYDDLSFEGGPESETEKMDDVGDFEGSTVRFKWDEDASDYVVSFEEGSGDEEALADLSPDMDFLALLPEGEVAAEDTWTVTGEKLATVFLPGGMIPLPEDEQDGEMAQVIEDELTGQISEAFKDFEVRCTYAGSREEEGKQVGEIAFEFEGKASLDLSDLASTLMELQTRDQEMDIEAEILATLDLEFKGEGVLLWDLSARHVHDFKMSSDMSVLADVEASMEMMGETQKMAMNAEISGEGEWTMETSEGE